MTRKGDLMLHSPRAPRGAVTPCAPAACRRVEVSADLERKLRTMGLAGPVAECPRSDLLQIEGLS